MTGAFRLFLALLVVVGHLVGTKYASHFGYYAVRLFFVLSGLALTAALNEVYHFDGKRFAVNRLLRLVPLYYLACLGTWLVIELDPHQAGAFMGRWTHERDFNAILMNLLILPLNSNEPIFRFAEQSWSLSVELFMYVLLWFAIARSSRMAFAGFCIGAVYHLTTLLLGFPFSFRYFEPASAVMSFSIGALIYFARKNDSRLYSPRLAAIVFPFWLANLVLAGWIVGDSYALGAGYYASTAMGAVIVGGLVAMKPSPAMRRVDDYLGELAYPVFLLHWLAGFIAHMMIAPDAARGWALFFATIPVLLAMSSALAILNAKFVEPLRNRIRPRMTPAEQPVQSEPAPVSQRASAHA